MSSKPLGVAKSALPFLAKQLPKLWPLLLESKNREKVGELVRDLAAKSPRRTLAAKMELTELLAETMLEQATALDDKEQAADWRRRARKMRMRLDMPVVGLKARRRHRSALRADLTALHEEMSAALSD